MSTSSFSPKNWGWRSWKSSGLNTARSLNIGTYANPSPKPPPIRTGCSSDAHPLSHVQSRAPAAHIAHGRRPRAVDEASGVTADEDGRSGMKVPATPEQGEVNWRDGLATVVSPTPDTPHCRCDGSALAVLAARTSWRNS